MKKQTPVTYEHIGWLLLSAFILFGVLLPAIFFWIDWVNKQNTAVAPPDVEFVHDTQWQGEVKSIVCYNLDGTGPVIPCPAKIECHNEPKTNSTDSKIPCPIWP